MAANSTPYYIIPTIEEFKIAKGEDRVKLAAKIALVIGNPIAVRTVLGISPEEFSHFYPDMELPELTTDDTIDTFLDKFGDPSVKKRDNLDDIMTPAPSYNLDDLELLPEIEGSDSNGIPTFNLESKPANAEAPQPAISEEREERNASTSIPELEEKLKILIKNRDYQGAIDTINEINLNNPKKSIYFADQIRFLKKLIELSN